MVAFFATSTVIYICVQLAFGIKCKDDVESNNRYETFKSGVTKRVPGKICELNCKQLCLDNIKCMAAISNWGKNSCIYTETPNVKGVFPEGLYTLVSYFKVRYRCPIHYSCDEQPCKNGATCEVVENDGQFGSTKNGSKCHCADGYKPWFCEKKYNCSDDMCQNQGNCSMPTGTNRLIQCTCDPMYTGFYCNETVPMIAPTAAPTNSTGMTRKTKTVIAIVATTVLAAGAIGATASAVGATTAAAALATTAGGAAASGTAAG